MPAPTVGHIPGATRTTSVQNLPMASAIHSQLSQGPPPLIANGNRNSLSGFQSQNSVGNDQGFYQVRYLKSIL
jgi:hypothetical protein